MHVNYKCSVIESSYTVVAVNKPSYIHNVLSYYSLWQPLHIFNFFVNIYFEHVYDHGFMHLCMHVHLFNVGAELFFRISILKIGHIQTEVTTWCLLIVKYFPENSGVVIAVVIVVIVLLIIVGCITMDILFCYCCKRKQCIQDNGMYIG